MRVVSLLPSATEIVCALGAGSSLVGVSHECDHPSDVRDLPAVTRAKLDAGASSAVIDRRVRTLVEQGLGVYEIDVARLRELRPDVIVTQNQCDVCAVSYADVEAAARRVLGDAVTIVSLTPHRLIDVWDDVERVATALDRVAAGRAVIAQAQERLASVTARVRDRPRPTVACIEWLDPLMMAANWTPELVEIAGGSYPFAPAGVQSTKTDWATLAAAKPDVVVLMPCGFPVAQTRRELATFCARPEWRRLPAVRTGRAWIADGNAYFNRPGPRLVESAEILAGLLHPGLGIDPALSGAVEAIR